MFMKSYPLKIIVASNYSVLSKIASEKVLAEVKRKPNLCLSLPTGKTPLGMYFAISKEFYEKKISFAKATFFELDEFVLDDYSKHQNLSFRKYLEKNLFQKTDFNKNKLNFFSLNAVDLNKECRNYEKKLSKKNLDLIVLGMGLNGHIAFNLPSSSVHSRTRVVNLNLRELDEHHRKKMCNTKRIKAFTIGIANILKAKKIIMLVSGKHKSKIMRKFIKMSRDPKAGAVKRLPALALCFHPNAEIIVDLAALS